MALAAHSSSVADEPQNGNVRKLPPKHRFYDPRALFDLVVEFFTCRLCFASGQILKVTAVKEPRHAVGRFSERRPKHEFGSFKVVGV